MAGEKFIYQIDDDSKKYVAETQVYNNTGQKLIVITEDKMRLCLMRHVDKLGRKSAWQVPFGLFIAILLAHLTSNFHDYFNIKAATWEALFLLSGGVALIWFLCSIKNAFASVSIDNIINELMVNSSRTEQETRMPQQSIPAQPDNTDNRPIT